MAEDSSRNTTTFLTQDFHKTEPIQADVSVQTLFLSQFLSYSNYPVFVYKLEGIEHTWFRLNFEKILRIKKPRNRLWNLSKEELFWSLKWNTNIYRKSPLKISPNQSSSRIVASTYLSVAEWSPGRPAASPTYTDFDKSTPTTSKSKSSENSIHMPGRGLRYSVSPVAAYTLIGRSSCVMMAVNFSLKFDKLFESLPFSFLRLTFFWLEKRTIWKLGISISLHTIIPAHIWEIHLVVRTYPSEFNSLTFPGTVVSHHFQSVADLGNTFPDAVLINVESCSYMMS